MNTDDARLMIPLPDPDRYTLSQRHLVEGWLRGQIGAPWVLESVTADGRVVVADTSRVSRTNLPCHVQIRLGDKWSDDVVGRYVAAIPQHYPGRVVVQADARTRTISAAALDRDLVAIRDRIADVIGCKPWDLELDWTLGVRTVSGVRTTVIEELHILRAPEVGKSAEKRLDFWGEIAQHTIGHAWGAGCRAELDDAGRIERLVWGPAAQLPFPVLLLGDNDKGDPGLLPSTIQPDDWKLLPVGINTAGEAVGLNLKAGPHTLIVGPTGSGKGMCARVLMASALARDFDLVLLDAMKGGLDFKSLWPFCAAVAEDLAACQSAIEAVYREVERRRTLVKAHMPEGADAHWTAIPENIRQAENVKPLLVVIDEYGSLIMPEPEPKGLDRDSPILQEIQERNLSKAALRKSAGFDGVEQVPVRPSGIQERSDPVVA